MLKILKQPYPHAASNHKKLLISLATGFFIALFLIYFQPFGISDYKSDDKIRFLSGYGIITATIMLFIYFVVPAIFPAYFKEQSWTVGREITVTLANVTLIAVANIFYSQISISGIANINGLLSMISYTLALGIFPITGIVVTNYIYHLKQYSQPPQPTTQVQEHQHLSITLTAENEKDKLSFSDNELFYIESSDNYSTVIYEQDGQIFKEIIRSSLIRLESQISSSYILRCHRSYIVNLDKVVKISGNAQGYKLHLKDSDFIVPVARKYSEIVNRFK
jgi:hypothetical protein